MSSNTENAQSTNKCAHFGGHDEMNNQICLKSVWNESQCPFTDIGGQNLCKSYYRQEEPTVRELLILVNQLEQRIQKLEKRKCPPVPYNTRVIGNKTTLPRRVLEDCEKQHPLIPRCSQT